MLSIKAFGSAGAAQTYYSHGDYYGTEGKGVWVGEGTKDLGLSGEFAAKTEKAFGDLLKGILPDGQVLGKKTAEGIEHRPGIDLTFSCPKSFSIQMLVYADKQERKSMEVALSKAISSTLGFIEERGYVIARKGKGGVEKEPIKKLTFATFAHTTNRNLEPQAHVHCFLANAGKCNDGKFRSLSFDNVLNNNKLLGQVFRNELALEVKKLNYEIEIKILSDGSSSFELTKIDPKLIKAFSTRRQEIEELCKKYGVTTKEGRDKIVINSRKAKQSIKEEVIIKAWKELESSVQKEILKEKASVVTQNQSISEKPLKVYNTFIDISKMPNVQPHSAKDLAQLSIKDISYNNTVFTTEELTKKALKFSIGKFSPKEIQKELHKLEKGGDLIRVGNKMTTKELLEKEKQVLQFAKNGLGTVKEIISSKHFESRYAAFERRERSKDPKFQMNDQQKKALKHILTSRDKITAVEGLPGVGKSTILNAVRDISGRKVINLIGLGDKFQGSAPTASAAQTLANSAGIRSKTLHSFLADNQKYIEGKEVKVPLMEKSEFKKTTIFLDESSLVSTRLMHDLLKVQDKLGFKLVATGDSKQLGAVESGKPFEQMLSIVSSVKLDVIVRQKKDAHKEAIIATSKGEVGKSFDIHKDNIKSQSSVKKIVSQAVKLYLEKDTTQRNQTLLISPTRQVRDKINNAIVKELEKEGSLKGQDLQFMALKQKDMSLSDYRFVASYEKGDVVKFNKNYKNGISKDGYYTVDKTSDAANSLIVVKDGRKYVYKLNKDVAHEKKLEVYKEQEIKLKEGIKIKFTKNNKTYGLNNSDTAVIQKINKDTITMKAEGSMSQDVPKTALKHIDYGYCHTIHASQGKTYGNTIAAISDSKLLNTQKLWLVALSRHKSGFTAIVEDREKLKSYLMKNSGNELSAIELVKGNELKQNELQQHKNEGKMVNVNGYNMDT